mgnify:CR=1 FL=1
MKASLKTKWGIVQIPEVDVFPNLDDSTLEGWADLQQREHKAGVRPGQWILFPIGSRPDGQVAAFCNSLRFQQRAAGTQLAYLRDLKVFFDFLSIRGKAWREATANDLRDYEFWRRRDPDNPRRVSGSKFNRELAALNFFYRFQVRQGSIRLSPVDLQKVTRRDGIEVSVPELRSKRVQSSRVNWLTPAAYRQWARIGLGGYNAEGLRDEAWRGRNDGRNLAFAELLWTSGLRLQEASSLLLNEMPSNNADKLHLRGRLSGATTKNGAGRDFWVSARAAALVEGYLVSTRQLAVDRARDEGRYESLPGLRVVTRFIGQTRIRYVDSTGLSGEASLNQIGPQERMRLFTDGPDGLEPLALWLGDSGLPMKAPSWQAVFQQANARTAAEGQVTDVGPLVCRPHMLRHSFALRMLVTMQHLFDRRLQLTAEERKAYLYQFGDIWTLVAQLMGHKNPETTRSVYLVPVQGLQLDHLLNGAPEEATEIAELLSRIAAESGLVHDLPAERRNVERGSEDE